MKTIVISAMLMILNRFSKNMRRILITVCTLIVSTTIDAQSIKDLDFLVGSWKVSEVVFPGSDREYIETGARVCGYYLGESYIK